MSAGAESMEVAGGAREADVVVGSVGGTDEVVIGGVVRVTGE